MAEATGWYRRVRRWSLLTTDRLPLPVPRNGNLPITGTRVTGPRKMESIKSPLKLTKYQEISPSVNNTSHRLAGLPLMPKQCHVKSDNDSGHRLRGKALTLAMAECNVTSWPHVLEVVDLCAIKG